MRICELREKEVINIRNCQRLGRVLDIEFDLHTGAICQLILPGPSRFCGFFGRDAEYLIGWKCIRQIGADIILVDVDLEKCMQNPTN